MDIENLAKELILKNMTPEQQMAVLDSVRQSVANAKEVQKKKIGENVNLVVQALKKIETEIQARYDAIGTTLENRVASIKDGKDGKDGRDGVNGREGKAGRDGAKGDKGDAGLNGRDGVDGKDGVSVTDAKIDFDGSLVISLSSGQEINVGEVVSQDIAEKIKVISTMSTNGAVAIKDEGTSITSGVKTINFVGATVTATNSGDDVTVNVSAGTGTVTSVGLSGGTTGLTVSGSPITTTGTITLGGTLAVANGGTGTATPSLVAGTNITSITGTWPNQTINASGGSGTVTSVAATAGTGISITGSPITTSGTLNITNTAPDQTVSLTASTGITTSGTYPNFTITNSAPDQTVALTAGTGISTSGTYPNFTITNSGVTSIGVIAPVATTGGSTPTISLASGYGDTQNPYGSKTANFVLAAPDGSAGVPTFRAIVAADIPTLNQNTTGSAATLTTGRTIAITGDLTYTSPSFNGSANVTAAGTLATVNSNVGSFTAANITVNAKGLITAASNGTAGASISNDTSTATNLYPLFANATSGTPTTVYTSNAKLLYKPSTGELQATALVASNGIMVNSQTVSADYTIASGNNGLSAGTVSVATGVTVTIATGSVWTVV